MGTVDVSYQAVQVNNSDEAMSLAYYLNEHGMAAFQQPDNEVNVPMVLGDEEAFAKLSFLKKTWGWFWENSDSGLFGLPVYVKD